MNSDGDRRKGETRQDLQTVPSVTSYDLEMNSENPHLWISSVRLLRRWSLLAIPHLVWAGAKRPAVGAHLSRVQVPGGVTEIISGQLIVRRT